MKRLNTLVKASTFFKKLTTAQNHGYALTAAPHGQSGLESCALADVPPQAAIFTFVTSQPCLGGGVGRLLSRRFLCSVLQPTLAAHPDWSHGDRFNHNRKGVTP